MQRVYILKSLFFYEFKASTISVGSKGNNSLVKSLALFFKTDIEGPTPHVIAYLIRVCSLVGPARPKLIGKSICSLSSTFNHSMTG